MSQLIKQAFASDSGASALSIWIAGKQTDQTAVIPRADAASAPTLKMTGGTTGPYMAVTVDPDAPFVSFPILGPILHWIQLGLKAIGDGTLSSDEPASAAWQPVQPPPGSGPHRYLVLLFEQPTSVEIAKIREAYKDVGFMSRVRFDLDGFVKQYGLGEVVASQYFNSV